MVADVIINADTINWIAVVIAFGGFLLAIVALWQTSRANRSATQANEIAREANALSERTMRLQEDDAKVRLVVTPRIMLIYGEEGSPRPFVEVRNLSSFAVTIEKIHWKTDDGKWLYWKNPDVCAPYGKFPARLGSRENLTAMGAKIDPKDNLFQHATAAVAFTACGEEVGGMTDQFLEEVRKVGAPRQGQPPATEI